MNSLDSAPPRNDTTGPWLVPLLTVLVVVAAVGFYWLDRSRPFDTDSPHYILMAEGRIAEVGKPFTARVLQPAVAGFISRTTGLSIDASFFATNLVCLTVLVSAGLSLILGHIRSAGLALAIVLCPMTLMLFREIYMPDCMHAALVAVFFLLLWRKGWWYAVPLLFFMQVTRDSTVLLTFALVLVGAYHRMWKVAVVAILVTVFGIVVVSRVASEGRSNIHDSNTLVYLVGKVPFNFLTNVCGLRMWTNTHAKNNPAGFPNEPLYSFELPGWVPTGSMRQVGIYNIAPEIPLALARIMLTSFGVMPSVALLVIAWRRWRLAREDGLPFSGQLSLTYGSMALLLGPCIGASIGRLVGYAWPLGWIAAPELLVCYFNTTKRLVGQLTGLQATACWTPLLLTKAGVAGIPSDLISVAVALTCHVVAFKLLRRNRIAEV